MGHKLRRTPRLYGMGHPSKYSVTSTYRISFPLMVALSHGIKAADVPVYAFPKLIFMECMFACLFFSASKYDIRIHRKLGLLRGRCHLPILASSDAGRLLRQAHAVYALLFEFHTGTIPHWAPST